MKYIIKDWLIEKANKSNFKIKKEYDGLKELASFLPHEYYVCGMVLWCNNLSVEIDYISGTKIADGIYDYGNAFIKMLLKINMSK